MHTHRVNFDVVAYLEQNTIVAYGLIILAALVAVSLYHWWLDL